MHARFILDQSEVNGKWYLKVVVGKTVLSGLRGFNTQDEAASVMSGVRHGAQFGQIEIFPAGTPWQGNDLQCPSERETAGFDADRADEENARAQEQLALDTTKTADESEAAAAATKTAEEEEARRVAAEKAEQERLDAEAKAAAEKAAKEQAEADAANADAAEKAEAARLAAEQASFAKGDTVYLRSGGPAMIITKIKGDEISTKWVGDEGETTGKFERATLTKTLPSAEG